MQQSPVVGEPMSFGYGEPFGLGGSCRRVIDGMMAQGQSKRHKVRPFGQREPLGVAVKIALDIIHLKTRQRGRG